MRSIALGVLAAVTLSACGDIPIDGMSRSGWTEPSSMPPAGYSGDTWVDDRGCVYVAAGRAGARTWVPMIGGGVQQVCR